MPAAVLPGAAATSTGAVMAEPAAPLVMHVIHHLLTGGMENGLVNLINRMPGSAYRHVVVCAEDFSDFRQRIVPNDVDVIALHRSRIGVWRLRREVYRLCRQLRPAIVHTRNLSGLDALLPARLAGVPRTVHSEHGWDVDNLRGEHWKPRLLRRLHSPLVDRYITVSKDLQRHLVDGVGIAAARISPICNGVDTARFAPGTDTPRAALPASFRGEALVLIGTVGRVQPVKDQATLLRAFASMLIQHPALRATARLVVAGDGPLLADLRALATALGIAPLTWFAGNVTDIPGLMRALHVFVLPSLNEGISNTILEAMSSQLPVIASAVGGNAELVSEGAGGALFQAGDSDALAAWLSRYVVDADLRHAQGRIARQRALDQHSLDSMVEAYRRVYDRLLSSTG